MFGDFRGVLGKIAVGSAELICELGASLGQLNERVRDEGLVPRRTVALRKR